MDLSSIKTGSQVGKSLYLELKRVPPTERTEQQQLAIDAYEELQERIQASVERNAEYLASLVDKDLSKPVVEMTPALLQAEFKKHYPFELMEEFKPILAYFSKRQSFFNYPNLHGDISQPSFEKGLLVIGGYGNGKTTFFHALQQALLPYDGHRFKFLTANECVQMREEVKDSDSKIGDLVKLTQHGRVYFDDLLTERDAFTPGRVNFLKEVLEGRYTNLKRGDLKVTPVTFASMNFPEGKNGDIDAALEAFGERYGARLYDRIFEMFNIITITGKSLRK
jgi:DNA replication protein DnaC